MKLPETLAALVPDPTTISQKGLGAVSDLIYSLIDYALLAAGALSIILIVISGINFATSAGDPARLKSAKSTLVYAIGGLVLSLIAVAVVNTVFTVLS